MRKVFAVCLAVCMLLPTVLASAVFAAEPVYAIYVAVDGDDSNEGSIHSPLATLEAAGNRVQDVKKAGADHAGVIRVYLR